MRVASFLAKFTVIVLLIVGSVYFFGGIVMLQYASSQFTQDLADTVDHARTAKLYEKTCASAPGASPQSTPLSFQLRFTSPSSYVVEVVCSLIAYAPVEIARGELPRYVDHVAGTAGISVPVLGPDDSYFATIALQSLGKVRTFTITEKDVTIGGLQSEAAVGTEKGATAVASVCTGYGYRCCQERAELGSGDQATTATDCPTTCFATCTPIPFFQSFVPDPYPEEGQQILLSSNRQTVMFTYTAVSDLYPITEISIDYGDGSSETSKQAIGLFTHEYSCEGTCSYVVKIRATDAKGRSSVENQQTTFYIGRI